MVVMVTTKQGPRELRLLHTKPFPAQCCTVCTVNVNREAEQTTPLKRELPKKTPKGKEA